MRLGFRINVLLMYAGGAVCSYNHGQISQVGADHYVGIYAKRTILAGEELTFNYRYSEDHRTWNKRK